MLRISVLGPVRAWSGDRPIELGGARPRTVFAVLTAAAGRTVSHREMIAAVWGSAPPATAQANLYTYVSGLRQVLADGVLESRRGGYVLHVADGAVDSERFVAMCAEALARPADGDAADRLADALRLWHGEPYAGLGGDLLEVERHRLTRRRLDAIERRARWQLERGDDALIAELTALAGEYPLHEPLHELLMRALHQAGRSAEALDTFRIARGVLTAELGVEPGPALRAAHGEILVQAIPASADLSRQTQELVRRAVLLGPQFRVGALIAVAGRPPLEVLAGLDEALAAGVLAEAGAGLTVRDSSLARRLHDSIPGPVRARRHRRMAEVLAGLGSPAAEVAAQLTAETLEPDDWILSWFTGHVMEVTEQVPQLAARIARLLLGSALPTSPQRTSLLVAYARSDFRAGGRPRSAVRQALAVVSDPAERAEMRQILATLLVRDGALAAAKALLSTALEDERTPPIWRTRHRVLLTRQTGSPADDPYARTAALQAGWLTNSVAREHEQALHCADEALGRLGRRTPFVELYLDLLDNRIFSLQNLDRLDEAQQSLHEASLVGARHRLDAPLVVASVVQHFWAGRWDDALAQISAVTDDAPGVGLLGMREQRAGVLLLHGVAALIAVHRDDAGLATAHLRSDAVTGAERENSDFLIVARALLARWRDRPAVIAPLFDPGYAPMLLRHQWMPGVVRSARRAGRFEVAERAVELCAAEAAMERTPARAGAALARCRSLMSGDPEPALSAAEHYRAVGRMPELAFALEDAAALLAARGHGAEAARRGQEAIDLYQRLGARRDLRRLRARLGTARPGQEGFL